MKRRDCFWVLSEDCPTMFIYRREILHSIPARSAGIPLRMTHFVKRKSNFRKKWNAAFPTRRVNFHELTLRVSSDEEELPGPPLDAGSGAGRHDRY